MLAILLGFPPIPSAHFAKTLPPPECLRRMRDFHTWERHRPKTPDTAPRIDSTDSIRRSQYYAGYHSVVDSTND
jgi:hypothetical protein